ncbi:MAG: ribonuclease R [Pseudomonadota bacterium]
MAHNRTASAFLVPPKKNTSKSSKAVSGAVPSRQEIIAFVKETGGHTSRRDIARHFGLKGAARAELRAVLKELSEDGAIEMKGGARISQTGALAPVAPVDVMSVDDDGDLLCMPVGWRSDNDPPMIRLAARDAAKTKPPPGVGDRLLVRLKPAGDDSYSAQVIRAIGKGAHRFLALYHKQGHGGVAEPVERRARNDFTIERGDDGGAQDGDLVWVETKNARGYGPAKARVRAIAGHIDDRHAYSLIALANHAIPVEFPAAALEEAEKAKLPSLGERTDLRDTPLFTIDPADAKDHDDACFAEPVDDPDNPGGYRVIVAIADVSYFVRPGGALDREALKRGNSVYLPDSVTPMLPERLSTDLCSLRAGEDRPCLAVEMIIDANGRKREHKFIRAMMRSAAKLSYEDAQAIIDGGRAKKEIKDAVLNLHAAFKLRWREREKRAPLDLDLPERRIVLGADGHVDKVVRRTRFDAHRLIEEFMILANVAAAETLERAKAARIYRVHDTPDPERLESARDYLATLDYSLIKGGEVRPGHFNQLLKIASARDEKEMVSEIVLRSQRQAIYDTENRGHFGLNLARYAHFTSPIRRYADLTVHRALVTAAGLGEGGQSKEEAAALGEIAERISDYERRAMAAEREANDRYLADYLADAIGAEFDARIRGVTRFGLFVMLDETGADGFIPMRHIGAERFRFEEDHHAVIGETTKGVYRLGQAVRVRLAEATPLTGGLRFDMVSEPIEAALPKGSRKGAKKTTRKKPKSGKSSGKKSTRKKRSDNPRKARKRGKSNAKPRKD